MNKSNCPSYETAKLSDFVKGWFVGEFDPTLHKTPDVEVGIKYYRKGDREVSHHHNIATELTAVVSGRVYMLGHEFCAGDIVKIRPGTSTEFEALEDSVTVVVKHPGARDDKYLDT
jgi:hypothetical protein